jgi:ATP-dependent Zn protease
MRPGNAVDANGARELKTIPAALLRRFALHEAGHAVACVVLGRRLRFVELRQTKDGPRGRVVCGQHPALDPRRARNRTRVRRMVEREIMIAWAGLAAEELFYRRDLRGIDDDAETIVGLLRRLERDKALREDLGARLLGAARRMLREHRRDVERVARVLAERGRLPTGHAKRLVRGR